MICRTCYSKQILLFILFYYVIYKHIDIDDDNNNNDCFFYVLSVGILNFSVPHSWKMNLYYKKKNLEQTKNNRNKQGYQYLFIKKSVCYHYHY